MRKFFIFLVSALLVCSICSMLIPQSACAEGDESAVTVIDSAEDMFHIAVDPDGVYRLGCDINMAGVDWTPLPFSGVLYGDGYSIYNLKVTKTGNEVIESSDGNAITYDTVYSGLFSSVNYGIITDLNIVDALIEVTCDGSCYAAPLAGYSHLGTFSNCCVSARVILNCGGQASGTGGIVGFGSCIVTDCSVSTQQVFVDCTDGIKCEQFMGGILGNGRGQIEDCSVDISGFISCRGYVHSGGIIGMLYPNRCVSLEDLTDTDYNDSVIGNYVKGSIRFFEDNYDRRAYCASPLGENCYEDCPVYDNSDDFIRNEVFEYDTILYPETCAVPDIQDTVTEPTCSSWGFTEHKCSGCGNTYRDSYTSPRHVAGEYVTVEEPDASNTGLAVSSCIYCGMKMDEKVLPIIQDTASNEPASASSFEENSASPVTDLSAVSGGDAETHRSENSLSKLPVIVFPAAVIAALILILSRRAKLRRISYSGKHNKKDP